jgi:YfiH family protein
MLFEQDLIIPDWPAPSRVSALQTTRQGGLSAAPYHTLNLGMHVGDQPMTVTANRQLLNRFVPSEPIWLDQVHGTKVVLAEQASCVPQADACIARTPNAVCTVMTADCLPVLLCDREGTVVGAAHAGWRGLLAGVIESTIQSMAVEPTCLMAWLGPAIGPQVFEVGEEVRAGFVAEDAASSSTFILVEAPIQVDSQAKKYLANLYQLARLRLERVGVKYIYGGNFCTYTDAERFYSYRRDGETGRMASMIWLRPA